MKRDTDGQKPSTALVTCVIELPKTATARFPWRTVPRSPLLLSGSDTQRRGRPSLSGDLVPAGRPRAARRRPIDFTTDTAAVGAPSIGGDAGTTINGRARLLAA